ncbi:MAG: DUF362 domain-containing protein [Angelakisella sp.]
MQQPDICVMYGDDPYSMTRELLRRFSPSLPQGGTVAIKPNLVLPSPAEEGATTHPQIAAAVIDWLREQGVTDLFVAESAWVGADTAEAARVCGFETLCKVKNVPFYDLKQDGFVTRTVAGVPMDVSRRMLEADLIVNLPVLKGHCQTGMTCALKNMKGCLSDSSKRQFHALGLHKPIAALNSILPRQLAVVDGICGDLDFEEGGSPVYGGCIYAGTDPVLLDCYGAVLLGFLPDEIAYLSMAAQLGVGSMALEQAVVAALNTAAPGRARPVSARRVGRLAKHLCQDKACSACYAATVRALARLEDSGGLERLGEQLYLGQGWRGKHLDKAGIGSCTEGFRCTLPGCPPTAAAILAFLTTEG